MTPRLTAYVSTALTGVDDATRETIAAAVGVVNGVCAAPGVGIDVYFPGDHTDPVRDAHVEPEDVFRIDRDRVKSADVIIVLFEAPSVGVGQELNMALASLLPIVFLMPDAVRVSRMARGVPAEITEVGYADHTELREGLRAALVALRPRLEERKRSLAALDANVSGARVRALREQRRLSRADLAAATGLNARGVALLEESPDRCSDPSLTQLRRLAAALGVRAADLV
jgi:DNA-binding XRE family transcriptional regulator